MVKDACLLFDELVLIGEAKGETYARELIRRLLGLPPHAAG